MLKSYNQSIGLFMAFDDFCTFVNKICDLISFSMNSNFSSAPINLVDAGMP